MKVLQTVTPTPEQLTILKRDTRGTLIIRGAAGSGKTTTALLRLKVVVEFWQRQFERAGKHLNVLVLTYNRTLAGYVEALANEQVKTYPHVTIEVTTFGMWATEKLNNPNILSIENRLSKVVQLGSELGLEERFLSDEVSYVCGRFLPENLSEYLTIKREGRGSVPAMPRKLRERLLSEVVLPYTEWKRSCGVVDWDDMAIQLARTKVADYEIIVVDETQDFQANRIRAIINQLSPQHSLTFVLDSAQRIYPHSFKWAEVGIDPAGNVLKLSRNYRNTKQIAKFARPIIDGIEIGDDGAMPDFTSSERDGSIPNVLVGKFGKQMAWAVTRIKTTIDLTNETVAFLHPAGGGYFKEIRNQLSNAHLGFVELSRERDWPAGPENIALITMYSAKGLEFDHVFILGLNHEVTPFGTENGDANLESMRRLLAMAIGRARNTLTIGYKKEDPSGLVQFFQVGSFIEVRV